MKLERRGRARFRDFPQHSQKRGPIVAPRPAFPLSRDDAGRVIDRRRYVALPRFSRWNGAAPSAIIVSDWKLALKICRASRNLIWLAPDQSSGLSHSSRIDLWGVSQKMAFVAFEPLEDILKSLRSGFRPVTKALETIFEGIESHGCHFLDLAVHRSDWPFSVVTKRKLTGSLQEKPEQSCRVFVIFSVLRRGCHFIVPGGHRSCCSPRIE